VGAHVVRQMLVARPAPGHFLLRRGITPPAILIELHATPAVSIQNAKIRASTNWKTGQNVVIFDFSERMKC